MLLLGVREGKGLNKLLLCDFDLGDNIYDERIIFFFR